MALNNILPPNMFEVIDRAGISTAKQIITLSVWDIKKSTNLSIEDIILLKNMVTENISPTTVTGKTLKQSESEVLRLSTGCKNLDNLLNGGFRRGTITEVFGESGCGKTQLALQTTLYNWLQGCVYICTEDLFPTKRYEEIKINLSSYDPKVDYGKHIFVEHITEANDLLSCIRVRLPRLLDHHKVSLIVIDSVTAPFRCESTNYIRRAEDLRELAILMTSLAQKHNLVIFCINQVTASFKDSDNVLPSLGLAWSNMVTARLMLKKTLKIADVVSLPKQMHHLLTSNQPIYIRELSTVFAPDLPDASTEFVITSKGLQGVCD
ncbi:unnamed protein product [Chrysodeixis includens]|uniref:RecA family profile 1 domain-containing protein n=1 Tax=Chrysodeixis includens TaxID=689277 RepID=A0A9N8L4L5_CHRIL|nr:unnamed protein product [Chrysodeixis includens]